MRFRPVSSSAQQGGGNAAATLAPSSAQFSIPSLPSNGRSTCGEDLIRGAGGGASTNDNENSYENGSTATATATRSSTSKSSMILSPSPPPSSTKKKSGSNANKRAMIRSPMSFLSPNEKGSGRGSVNSSSVVGTSARKLFTSPTTTTRRTRHRKKRMGASTKSQPQAKEREEEEEETMMQEEGRTGDSTNDGDTTMGVVVVDFAYPTQEDVSIPGPAVLEYFHGLATRESPNVNVEDGTATTEVSTNAPVSTLTHQVQLDTLGTKLLSLEDVLIPSVVHEENAALKRIQAKLQRDPTSNAEAIQLTKEVRAFVMELGGNMAIAVKANRLEREVRHSVAERRRAEEEKAARKGARLVSRTERARAKEERRAQRAAERERARIKRKKNWPRNKELWREVAMLMTDLARLQKEERAWDEAARELNRREVELERVLEERKVRRQRKEEEEEEEERREKEGGAEEEETEGCDDVVREGRTAAVLAETSVLNAIDDITLAASRINATLGSISDLMAKSDEVRKEVYGKYRAEHQFHGYRGSRDTKGLIVALSQDC